MYQPFIKLPLSATIAFVCVSAHATEITSTSADQKSLQVTIYNDNLALVKDNREVTLEKGQSTLAFKNVSAQIRPETVIVKGNGVNLLEQNFEYDLLSPQTLLNKYVGKQIRVSTRNIITGEITESPATVLSNNDGTILKMGDNIRSLDGTMSVVYDNVPENLRDKPTMTMLVDSQTTATQPLELTYLTSGLSWKADYIIDLIDDTKFNLKGWVTLNNQSGTTYSDAQLQLVAGEVNQVQPIPLMKSRSYKKKGAVEDRSFGSAMAEESLFEYHLYTLGHKTTVKNKQQKQVSLLAANNVPYTKHLEIYGVDPFGWSSWNGRAEYVDLTAKAKLVIDNKKDNQLGMPIPAGIMRTYKKDSQGNTQFIGEDRIKHTAENGTITLELGDSFDVTAKRKQTAFDQQRSTQQNAVKKIHRNKVTASYEVIFNNAKNTDVTVDYFERFSSKWSITAQSLKSEKENSSLNHWRVNVPAKGNVVLTYTVDMLY